MLKPYTTYILATRVLTEAEKSGLIIPGSLVMKSGIYIVTSVGPDVRFTIPGDVVFVPSNAIEESLKFDDVDYYLFKETFVYGAMEKSESCGPRRSNG